jgi:hypothetical protein
MSGAVAISAGAGGRPQQTGGGIEVETALTARSRSASGPVRLPRR